MWVYTYNIYYIYINTKTISTTRKEQNLSLEDRISAILEKLAILQDSKKQKKNCKHFRS